jgi:hypothetical protein
LVAPCPSKKNVAKHSAEALFGRMKARDRIHASAAALVPVLLSACRGTFVPKPKMTGPTSNDT